MTNFEISERLTNLDPYLPLDGDFTTRLDANESFISSTLRSADYSSILADIELNRYPDPSAKALNDAFACRYSLKPELVTAGNGSDELIALITEIFLEDGEALMILHPDFSMYSIYPKIRNANCIAHYKDTNFDISVEKLLEDIYSRKPKMLIFSNPCNPTGKIMSKVDVLQIVKNSGILTVVDEAYMDFADEPQSVIQNINEFPNLIVLKTASKYGLAALRLGFAVSNSKITNVLKATKSPYNVNSLSQALGAYILSPTSSLSDDILAIRASRIELYSELLKLENVLGVPFEVVKSDTNFVFAKSIKASDIFEYLKKCGIAVRLFDKALRITAGSKSENALLLKSLTKLKNGI
ncbi:MAG: aminotransferase class I/II-fold pyridoxal phosphate-dependent enzyme [Christensenellaceae bacterium]|jgi:histidinol-phosphate aminotransferase|nr:aminotransferase class I/II-fold pyridoxal phosphate-dependent enzyme [Christensenellaceae bacterium]